jgi:hypothetical protein
MTSVGRREVTDSAAVDDPLVLVDPTSGGAGIATKVHVSTLRPLGHYCRPVSAGAVNHVTLGGLRTRAQGLVQRPLGATSQQGAG